jgi:hypothetical protein
MTSTTTATRRVAAQHDCTDHGCLAAILGVELIDTPAGNADGGSSGTLLG